MNTDILLLLIVAFLIGLIAGCGLGNHWIKVSFYWTQNKIRHFRDDH